LIERPNLGESRDGPILVDVPHHLANVKIVNKKGELLDQLCEVSSGVILWHSLEGRSQYIAMS
jgi:hypothetical protein